MSINGKQGGSERNSAWSFAKMEEKEKEKVMYNLWEVISYALIWFSFSLFAFIHTPLNLCSIWILWRLHPWWKSLLITAPFMVSSTWRLQKGDNGANMKNHINLFLSGTVFRGELEETTSLAELSSSDLIQISSWSHLDFYQISLYLNISHSISSRTSLAKFSFSDLTPSHLDLILISPWLFISNLSLISPEPIQISTWSYLNHTLTFLLRSQSNLTRSHPDLTWYHPDLTQTVLLSPLSIDKILD